MFDKLIESNSAGAEFKPRRTFFMVSFVVVGIVFLSALVFDLYAANIDLGTDNFELVQILAPVENDVPKPEPPREQPRQRDDRQTSELPNRPVLIERIDQPQQAPSTVSTTQNKYESIPLGQFTNDPGRAESNGDGTPIGPVGTGTSSSIESPVSEVVKVMEPPPVVKTEPKRPTTVSKGVVNGTAIELPKPTYPAVARAINLTGSVNVQVLIDEAGDVVSAKAIDGHAFFKLEAERAARRAKFRPTLLSLQPVKVTGVIVYRFTK